MVAIYHRRRGVNTGEGVEAEDLKMQEIFHLTVRRLNGAAFEGFESV